MCAVCCLSVACCLLLFVFVPVCVHTLCARLGFRMHGREEVKSWVSVVERLISALIYIGFPLVSPFSLAAVKMLALEAGDPGLNPVRYTLSPPSVS